MDKFIIEAAAGGILTAACLVLFILFRTKPDTSPGIAKKRKFSMIGLIISAWFTIGVIITNYSGNSPGMPEIEFEMFSERTTLFGLSLAKTTVYSIAITLTVTILLIILRLTAVRKLTADTPGRAQNILEIIVEFIDGFVVKACGDGYVSFLAPYMLAVALFMVGSAFTELLGLRAPTSELTCTLSLGFGTFILLNFCGIKKNGVGGRLKNMGGAIPAMRPVMIPLKAVSDIAIPVSLGCRLYGNMLGGMMVMDLLKSALGGYSSGIPAIAGLYFNLFHPGIQIYIFITLSLTFINEAME